MTGRSPGVYSIQVAAFRNRDYAERTLRRLKERGFEGTVEPSPEGIYRILVKDVPQGELPAVKQRLREHGWAEVVVRQQG